MLYLPTRGTTVVALSSMRGLEGCPALAGVCQVFGYGGTLTYGGVYSFCRYYSYVGFNKGHRSASLYPSKLVVIERRITEAPFEQAMVAYLGRERLKQVKLDNFLKNLAINVTHIIRKRRIYRHI